MENCKNLVFVYETLKNLLYQKYSTEFFVLFRYICRGTNEIGSRDKSAVLSVIPETTRDYRPQTRSSTQRSRSEQMHWMLYLIIAAGVALFVGIGRSKLSVIKRHFLRKSGRG